MGYQLELINVSKLFGEVRAVDNVSLSIQQGEFLTLLGPSGSGKTTTLNMIAGFEIPSRGDILLEAEDITTVAPNNRGIGMVFQNYALFPHMTVSDNIAFPLKMRKTPGGKIRQSIEDVLELVKLPGFEGRYPHQLSGGQVQRTLLAMAMVLVLLALGPVLRVGGRLYPDVELAHLSVPPIAMDAGWSTRELAHHIVHAIHDRVHLSMQEQKTAHKGGLKR